MVCSNDWIKMSTSLEKNVSNGLAHNHYAHAHVPFGIVKVETGAGRMGIAQGRVEGLTTMMTGSNGHTTGIQKR
jgi:hypothetical protein